MLSKILEYIAKQTDWFIIFSPFFLMKSFLQFRQTYHSCIIQCIEQNSLLISFPPISMWIPQASWQSGRAGRHKAAGLHAALKSAPGKSVMATMSFVSLRHRLSILKTSLPRWQLSVCKSLWPARQIQGQDR